MMAALWDSGPLMSLGLRGQESIGRPLVLSVGGSRGSPETRGTNREELSFFRSGVEFARTK